MEKTVGATTSHVYDGCRWCYAVVQRRFGLCCRLCAEEDARSPPESPAALGEQAISPRQVQDTHHATVEVHLEAMV